MERSVVEDKCNPGEWRAEALDFDNGTAYVTIFAGPGAQDQANEYAGWKNAQKSPDRSEKWANTPPQR